MDQKRDRALLAFVNADGAPASHPVCSACVPGSSHPAPGLPPPAAEMPCLGSGVEPQHCHHAASSSPATGWVVSDGPRSRL